MTFASNRHCEERSDEAIQLAATESGLPRFARNDDLYSIRHCEE